MKLVDLSHWINKSTQLYPGTPENKISSINNFEEDGYRESQFLISSHTATHIDAPAHILENGKYVHELPISNFYGKAFALDASKNLTSSIDESVIEQLTEIDNLDFILFYTGWDKMWDKTEYFKNYFYPSEKLAHELTNFKLKGVGIDGPSIDDIKSTQLPVHRILMEFGLILVENLCNLKPLVNKSFIFTCFPLNIENAEASPVRAVAMIDE